MSRWAPDAALRLETAALELFAEQGYADTTVPQIALRAGLTTRTFFRHFTDKRDVLFLRERELPVVVASVLADAPTTLSSLDLVMFGLETLAVSGFEQWRPEIAARRAIIRSDDRLRERELLKSSVLAREIGLALVQHGIEPDDAALLGSLAALVFDTSLAEWLDGDGSRPLTEVLCATRDRLQRVSA